MSNIGKHSVQTSLDTAGYHAGTLSMIKDVQAMALATGQSYDQVARTIDQGIAHRKAAALEQARIDKKSADEQAKLAGGGGFFGALSKLQVGFGKGEGGGIGGLMGSLGDIKDVAGSMNKWALGIGLAVGGYFALETAVKAYVRAGMDAIKMQDRMAQRLNISQGQSAAMIAVGAVAGQSPQDITAASNMALRHIGELKRDLAQGGGGGEAGASLRAMGIDPARFAAMTSWTDQLGLLADKLKGVANAADKAAFMHAILGRGAESLMPIMMQGGAALARYTQLAERFGVVVGGEARDGVLGAMKAQKEFQIVSNLATQGLQNQFTAGFTLATHGAQNYAEATRRITEMQPVMAQGMLAAGDIAGRVMGGAESAAIKFLAGLRGIAEMLGVIGALPMPAVPLISPSLVISPASLTAAENSLEQIEDQVSVAGRRAYDARMARERMDANSALPLTFSETGRAALAEQRASQVALRQVMDEHETQLARIAALRAQLHLDSASGISLDESAPGFIGPRSITASMGDAITEAGRQTEAIDKINRAWGLTADQIERNRLLQLGLTEGSAELARRDAARAQQLQNQYTDALNAGIRLQAQQHEAMTQEARTPLDIARGRIQDIMRDKLLTDAQRGALISRAVPSLGESPLLGSLSAGGADVGAILQQQQVPQLDRLNEISAILQAMAQDAERTRASNEAIGANTRGLLEITTASWGA